MGEKVIYLKNEKVAYDFLNDIMKYFEEDRVKEFIMIATVELEDNKTDLIFYDWFGKRSTMYILGLIERMRDVVMQWINEGSE